MSRRRNVSVLESEMGAVQGDDLSESTATALAAPPEPEQPPAAASGHPLELAPVNSKIVVTTEGAILSMPRPETQDVPAHTEFATLVRPDPAARLPVGAKISKTLSSEGETFYVATLLNSERPEEPSFHGSALEAFEQFPEIHYNR